MTPVRECVRLGEGLDELPAAMYERRSRHTGEAEVELSGLAAAPGLKRRYLKLSARNPNAFSSFAIDHPL